MESVLGVGGPELHVTGETELVSGSDGGGPEPGSGSGQLGGDRGQVHVARHQDVVAGPVLAPQVSGAHATVRRRGDGVGVLSGTKS